MPRLYRPHIPLEVRCRVVLRQLGECWPDDVIESYKPKPGDAYLKGLGGVFVPRARLAVLLAVKLDALAVLLDCKAEDLRLDHDPALATRMKRTAWHRGKEITIYSPDANSPDYLIYREKHAHLIKTNTRGEHGQHPDRVLIKKEKRRLKDSESSGVVLHGKPGRGRLRHGKSKWASRPLQSASRWPKRKMR